jgi:ferredoxin, 2Fe-2S
LLTLTGRTRTIETEAEIGASLLTHAQRADVDWAFNCSRGTCARCRCLVQEGADLLAEPTDAEWDRLGQDELEAGFRLGCQAVVARNGTIKAVNRSYF